jgi:hypothetical protein
MTLAGALGLGALGLGALGLGGCGVHHVAEVARYTGALPGCGLADSTLVRQGPQFTFTPGDGVLTIEGTVAADGSFTGALNTQGVGKPPFLLQVQGKLQDEQARVDYVTPRCRASATFARM